MHLFLLPRPREKVAEGRMRAAPRSGAVASPVETTTTPERAVAMMPSHVHPRALRVAAASLRAPAGAA